MQSTLSLARTAALAGAEVVTRRIGAIGNVRVKGDPTDVVTDTDIEAGTAIARTIAQTLPTARFVIEETEVYELADITEGVLSDSEVWVIDPLDGTTSFVHGFPCYSISVALLREGQPVAGIVHNIPAEETFDCAELKAHPGLATLTAPRDLR